MRTRHALLIALVAAKAALLVIGVVAFFLLTSCTTKHVAPPTPTLGDILKQRIAWVYDTIPVLKFDTPFAYGFFRLQVEACSGKTRLGWPRFFVAPISPLPPDNRAAFYAPQSQSIVFALGEEVQPSTIRHELLHWLLDPLDPTDMHPAEYFDKQSGKCGTLVNP